MLHRSTRLLSNIGPHPRLDKLPDEENVPRLPDAVPTATSRIPACDHCPALVPALASVWRLCSFVCRYVGKCEQEQKICSLHCSEYLVGYP